MDPFYNPIQQTRPRGSQLIICFDGLVETVILRAELEARNNGHSMMGAEYLILGALQVEEFRGAPYFGMFGITARDVNASIKLIKPYADKTDPIERADCFNRVLTIAEQMAEEFGSPMIATEHLAYGLLCLREGNIAFGIMNRHDVDILGMKTTIRKHLEEVESLVG